MSRIALRVSVWLVSFAVACEISATEPTRHGSRASRGRDRSHRVLSARALDKHWRKATDRSLAVRSQHGSIATRGQARIRGTTRVVLAPDERRGVLDVVFSGTVASQTTSDAGPVSVRSHATTHFTARQRFYLDDNRLTSSPAVCTAKSRSRIVSVSSHLPGLRGRIARNAGWRRARANAATIDRATASLAERYILQAFKADVAPGVARYGEALAGNLLQRIIGEGSRLRWTSSSDELRVTIVPADKPAEEPAEEQVVLQLPVKRDETP